MLTYLLVGDRQISQNADLNDTIIQCDLIEVNKTLHLLTRQCTYNIHINLILSHETICKIL